MVRLPSAACTSAQLSRCNQTTEYLPSDLEQLWLSNVATWEQQFCNSLQALENSTRVWLDTLAQLTSMQEQHMQQGDKSPAQVVCWLNVHVFSVREHDPAAAERRHRRLAVCMPRTNRASAHTMNVTLLC